MQASDEQRFTLEDVADTRRYLLVEEELGQGGGFTRSPTASREHLVDVDVVVAQVRAKPIGWSGARP